MPSLTTDVPHALPVPAASRRTKGLIARLRLRYAGRLHDVDERWDGDRGDFEFTLSGMRIRGSTEVLPGSVRVRVELPLLAMAFRSSIEQAIRAEVAGCLGGDEPGHGEGGA